MLGAYEAALIGKTAAAGGYPWTYDFESGVSGWVQSVSGAQTIEQSTTQVHGGTYSGKMTSCTTLAYGKALHYVLPLALDRTAQTKITLTSWVYLPSTSGVGDIYIRLGDAAFAGYGVGWGVNANDTYYLKYSNLTTLTTYIPNGAGGSYNGWFRFVMEVTATQVICSIYDSVGTLRGKATATDSTYTDFTRVIVDTYGGSRILYLDDLDITLTE